MRWGLIPAVSALARVQRDRHNQYDCRHAPRARVECATAAGSLHARMVAAAPAAAAGRAHAGIYQGLRDGKGEPEDVQLVVQDEEVADVQLVVQDEEVEGDLIELDPEVLRQMHADANDFDWPRYNAARARSMPRSKRTRHCPRSVGAIRRQPKPGRTTRRGLR